MTLDTHIKLCLCYYSDVKPVACRAHVALLQPICGHHKLLYIFIIYLKQNRSSSYLRANQRKSVRSFPISRR